MRWLRLILPAALAALLLAAVSALTAAHDGSSVARHEQIAARPAAPPAELLSAPERQQERVKLAGATDDGELEPLLVSGRVIFREGTPVGAALIVVLGSDRAPGGVHVTRPIPSLTATTEASGKFVIRGTVAAGPLRLLATRSGSGLRSIQSFTPGATGLVLELR